jgi:hypothetical protein
MPKINKNMSKKILFLAIVLIIGASFFVGVRFSSAAEATSTSSITVLSPNGGETWQAGIAQTVTWRTVDIPASTYMTIRLRHVGYDTEVPQTTQAINSGSASITPDRFYVKAGSYKIEIETYINNVRYIGISEAAFTITAAESSITISNIKVSVTGDRIAQGPNDFVDVSNVTISWTTNVPANSYVDHSTDPNFGGGGVIKDDSYVTEHTIHLDGFTSLGTKYYYKLTSQAADGSSAQSAVGNFTTSSVEYYNISNIQATNITSTSAVINWISSRPDISYLQYGTENSDNGINREARNDNKVTVHSLLISNLNSNRTYYFRISGDSHVDQNVTVFNFKSEIYNFTTLSQPLTNTGVTKLGDGTYELKEGDKVKLDNGLIIVPVYFESGSGSNQFHNVKFDVHLGATKLTTTDFTRVGWDTKTFEAKAAFYDNFNVKYSFKVYVDELATSGGVWQSKITFKSGQTIRLETGQTVESKTVQPTNQISQITANANLLANDKMGEILAELKQLRNQVKEQETEIRYLKSLIKDVKTISEKAQETINNFITYGVDTNTEKLGAGERAAVMNSYKAAFDKLPETEAELTDAIKIANGRWPSATSAEAESQAKAQFQKIYKRKPDMNGAKDAAAVTIMAYGLRQRAENRNLNSEKAGIKIFKAIYGHAPQTTQEWNIMQAITYSGATRQTWSGYNPQ